MEICRNTFDLLIDLCGDRHRRIVLGVFADQKRSLTTADLAKTIAKHERQAPLTQISEEECKQLHALLDQHHIPKLEEAGLVEYDREARRVEPTEQFDRVAPHVTNILEIDPHIDPPVEL